MALHEEVWIRSGRARPHECPACHTVCDAITVVGPAGTAVTPEVGDRSLCAYCGSVNIFLFDGRLRLATPEECEQLPEWAKHWMARRSTPRA